MAVVECADHPAGRATEMRPSNAHAHAHAHCGSVAKTPPLTIQRTAVFFLARLDSSRGDRAQPSGSSN